MAVESVSAAETLIQRFATYTTYFNIVFLLLDEETGTNMNFASDLSYYIDNNAYILHTYAHTYIHIYHTHTYIYTHTFTFLIFLLALTCDIFLPDPLFLPPSPAPHSD